MSAKKSAMKRIRSAAVASAWRRLAAVAAICLLLASPRGTRGGEPDRAEAPVSNVGTGPAVTVERTDGTAISGRLVRIDDREVTVDADGTRHAAPLETVRRVARTDRPAGSPRGLLLTWTDGVTIEGDDFAWDGKTAALVRPEGRIELPIERVRSLAWRPVAPPGEEAGAAAWMASIPESTASDLLAVSRAGGGGEAFEFVECAISAVSADAVTVVLDEETIPVKRSKILGLHWLRDGAAADRQGGLLVAVGGGSVRAGRIEWSPSAFVLDGEVRMPAELFGAVDYAAGRSVSLASLPTERIDVEPWFGPLGKLDGLANFFAPRTLPGDGEWPKPGLVMRPRTVAVWRLPADGRRFRAVVSPAAGRQAAGGAVVAVAVDDREIFRRQVDIAALADHDAVARPADAAEENGRTGSDMPGIPLDLDIAGGRRLTVTVDFCVPGATSAAVRFTDPVIEK
jgi:hypothetical protein